MIDVARAFHRFRPLTFLSQKSLLSLTEAAFIACVLRGAQTRVRIDAVDASSAETAGLAIARRRAFVDVCSKTAKCVMMFWA